MISFRWYMVDALIRWLIDNGRTPHIVVQADLPRVNVPQEHVKDNKIVLNVSPEAVHGFSIGPTGIEFTARFDGRLRQISTPAGAVVGVYAKGSETVFDFEPEEIPVEESAQTNVREQPTKKRGSHLRIID